MGLGAAALVTNQFRPPGGGGPPFPATAADNGLSVDVGTGRIVLGNDVGGVAATLLNAREIPLAGFSLQLTDPGSFAFFDAVSVGLQSLTGPQRSAFLELGGTNARVRVGTDLSIPGASNPSMQLLDINTPVNDVDFQGSTTGLQVFIDSIAPKQVLRLDFNNGIYGFGDLLNNGNGNKWTLSDTTNFSVLGNSTGRQIVMLPNTSYTFGDVDSQYSGSRLLINEAANQFILMNASRGFIVHDGASIITYMGDQAGVDTGTIVATDAVNGLIYLTNSANNVGIRINGVAGFTGTVTPVTSITVNNGIITAVA